MLGRYMLNSFFILMQIILLLCILSNFGSYPEIFEYYKDLDLVKCCGEC